MLHQSVPVLLPWHRSSPSSFHERATALAAAPCTALDRVAVLLGGLKVAAAPRSPHGLKAKLRIAHEVKDDREDSKAEQSGRMRTPATSSLYRAGQVSPERDFKLQKVFATPSNGYD